MILQLAMRQGFATTRLTKPDRLVFGALQCLVLAASLGYILFAAERYLSTGGLPGSDVAYFWAGAKISSLQDFHQAFSRQLYALEAVQHKGWTVSASFNYPPHFAVLLWPLGQLPYPLAFFLWAFLNPLILGAVVWAVFGRSWYAAIFAVLAPAAFFNLWVGQTGMLVAACLIGGMGLIGRRPILAGVFIGLLTCKPMFGILIPFALLAGRHWSTFISACLTLGGLLLWSFAVQGYEVWVAYFTSIPSLYLGNMAASEGLVTFLVPTVFMAGKILGFDPAVSLGVQALVAAVILACVIWAYGTRRHLGLCGALLFTGTLLASPLGHVYDTSAITMAVFLLLQDMAERSDRPGERFVAVIAWMAPVLVYFLNSAGVPVGPLIFAVLFGVLLSRLRSTGVASPTFRAGEADPVEANREIAGDRSGAAAGRDLERMGD